MRSRKPADDEVWNAVVTDKSRRMPDGSFLYRYLGIRLEDGTERKIRVDKALFDSVAIGDTLAKQVGHQPFRSM